MKQAKVSPEIPIHPTPGSGRPGLGYYLHVPFCASTCDFCAFYQEAPSRQATREFLHTLRMEIAGWGELPLASSGFIGGGTPGVLTPEDWEELGEMLVPLGLGQPGLEWTVELAPSTVKPEKLRVLRDLGFTRLSLGVQSFDQSMLDRLGRRQSANLARRAFDQMREAGFDNLNIDLIFGYPGQTLAAWRQDLEEAVKLAPEHLSTYCLTFEEDTELWVKLRQGQLRRSLDAEASLYALTWEFLPAAGYPQYEIANFSRPGRSSQHNINTWRMQSWLGFGPSAASQWKGFRWANPPDLVAWQAMVNRRALDSPASSSADPPAWPPAGAVEVVPLDDSLLFLDALIFGLRMNEGVDLQANAKRWPSAKLWPAPIQTILSELESSGDLRIENQTRVSLTESGRLRADAVACHLLQP